MPFLDGHALGAAAHQRPGLFEPAPGGRDNMVEG